MARTTPPFIRKAIRAAEAVSGALAYLSGGLLLLLGLFITADVLGRRFGGFYS
ncbi:MAG: hypothetical protein FJZ00_14045, partial [Candidatus Sericytochromatia bacterium]|nr:hypothetical protein [Candidatus Tanganyikabacteria bacterium]